ncbi:pantoate--beta-alanine ligase [Paraconexibacter sp.]|uniref:pantoate--beta-alanine ligase n=1 Tax=Paraconexibacter sp. TaxID=2949640 RepID=UPI00356927E2
MRTVRTVAEVRELVRAERAAGRSIGLVPTMGALHDGHLSLLRQAGAACDVVVMSLFVNPTQFNEGADLDAYPRDEAADAQAARSAGCAILFAPDVKEVYPDGFCTTVEVAGPLTSTLEGAHRGPSHFHGVTTVVTKLLNMVQPDVAFFGQKDAQQALVIRRLVRDLDMPVRIVVGDTVREPDGLARSSRNVRLSGEDRARATGLSRALRAAEQAVVAGERDADAVAAAARATLTDFAVDPEYLAVVDPETLAPRTEIDGDVLVAVAARVGAVRLIDNVLITTTPNGRG